MRAHNLILIAVTLFFAMTQTAMAKSIISIPPNNSEALAAAFAEVDRGEEIIISLSPNSSYAINQFIRIDDNTEVTLFGHGATISAKGIRIAGNSKLQVFGVHFQGPFFGRSWLLNEGTVVLQRVSFTGAVDQGQLIYFPPSIYIPKTLSI